MATIQHDTKTSYQWLFCCILSLSGTAVAPGVTAGGANKLNSTTLAVPGGSLNPGWPAVYTWPYKIKTLKTHTHSLAIIIITIIKVRMHISQVVGLLLVKKEPNKIKKRAGAQIFDLLGTLLFVLLRFDISDTDCQLPYPPYWDSRSDNIPLGHMSILL